MVLGEGRVQQGPRANKTLHAPEQLLLGSMGHNDAQGGRRGQPGLLHLGVLARKVRNAPEAGRLVWLRRLMNN